MPKDLYGVLGLTKDASADDLKRAYRKMSKEWHPDKHKGDKAAEDKFKEINEAYETLSDPQKKQMYDQFGKTSSSGNAGAGGFGGFDYSGFSNAEGFSDLGDLFGSFFGGGRQRSPQDTRRGQDYQIDVTITLQDALTGVQYPVELKRMNVCDTCSGSGAEPGSKVVTCDTCGGTGEIVRSVNSFFGQIRQSGVCTTCNGSGSVPEKKCHACHGNGRRSEKTRVVIDIPAGIDDGQSLRIRGQGDAGERGAEKGDLFVRIRVRHDDRFERSGTDIRSVVDIPVTDAILGGSVDVETLHGISTLAIPEGTQPGTTLRIKGKGLPELGRTSHVGDHYVTVNVIIPKKISRAEKKLLEEWKEMQDQ